MAVEERFLRPADVAVRLGISRTTVYTLLRTGQLKSVVSKPAGTAQPKMAIPESAVQEYERQRTAAGV